MPVTDAAFAEQILKVYWRDGLLIAIPSDESARLVVLEKLAEDFEPGREYAGLEVNFRILDHYDDYRSVLKEMLTAGVLEKKGAKYVRPVRQK